MNTYAGRKALITGGTIGMGLGTAKALVAQGADVVVTGRSEQNIDAARRELGDGATVVRSDTTDLAEIEKLAKVVETDLGHLDFVLINAGVGYLAPFGQVTEEVYDRTFATNTKGAFFTAQQMAPLVRDGGAFVFTTSIANNSGSAGMSVYSGSKAALRSFAKVLAAELLPRRIRVNALSPGFIRTPTAGMTDAPPEALAMFEEYGEQVTPMKRHGTVDEFVRAALFLGFEATFTTGFELTVDGGLSQQLMSQQS